MKFQFPTPYTVLMFVIVLAAAATWLLPAGNYNTLTYQSDSNTFVMSTPEGPETFEASQSKLDELGIPVEMEKFRSGAIQKPISVPGTYSEIESNPQGIIAVFMAPIKGMYEVIDIVLLVLIIGGFIGVFNHSGALDEGIMFLAGRLEGRESLLVIFITSLIALGGTTFGMAEETLAFYPILVPVFLAAGYDRLVPLAVIFIGSTMGTMASTTNPFSTIIASDAAGISWTVGIESRVAMLIIGTAACIIYIIRYGNKVRKDPSASYLHGKKAKNPFSAIHLDKKVSRLPLKTLFLLTIFAGTFAFMIYGVAFMSWWLEEMTVLFLISSIAIGLIQRTNERVFVKEFVDGAKDLLGVCLIIAIARGVTIVMNDGHISDTILHNAVQVVEGTSGFLFLPSLLVVFFVLTFFISSTSGLAVVSMPIMSSLSQIIGVPVEEIVNAYLFGAGLMFFISPTGLVLPSLGMVNVDYDSWLKFIWPLVAILAVVAVLILWMGLFF